MLRTLCYREEKKESDDMNKKFNTTSNWIGIGTAIGAAVFAATNEPTWLAVGVAVGAGLSYTRPKK
ncbi:MAG: hypothetical protein ACPGAO_03460 [Flavobacteriaceae bacterium]